MYFLCSYSISSQIKYIKTIDSLFKAYLVVLWIPPVPDVCSHYRELFIQSTHLKFLCLLIILHMFLNMVNNIIIITAIIIYVILINIIINITIIIIIIIIMLSSLLFSSKSTSSSLSLLKVVQFFQHFHEYTKHTSRGVDVRFVSST